jgi:uncharacterized protein YfaT (DUF1175 family)
MHPKLHEYNQLVAEKIADAYMRAQAIFNSSEPRSQSLTYALHPMTFMDRYIADSRLNIQLWLEEKHKPIPGDRILDHHYYETQHGIITIPKSLSTNWPSLNWIDNFPQSMEPRYVRSRIGEDVDVQVVELSSLQIWRDDDFSVVLCNRPDEYKVEDLDTELAYAFPKNHVKVFTSDDYHIEVKVDKCIIYNSTSVAPRVIRSPADKDKTINSVVPNILVTGYRNKSWDILKETNPQLFSK